MRADKQCLQFTKYYRHSHASNEQSKYNELKVLNTIKQKCSDLTTLLNEKKQSVRDIFYSILSKYPDCNLSFAKHERSLQLIRSAALPNNPLLCDDVAKMFERQDVMQLVGTTKDGGAFLTVRLFSSSASIELFEKKLISASEY